MQSRINKWGNSAAVRIPTNVLTELGLSVQSTVEITVKDGCIMIEPIKKSSQRLQLPFSEEDLLEGLDPHNAHSDEVAKPTSKEFGG